MIDSFLLQVGLWGASATLSALAITQYYNFRRKERNLPAACEFEVLETELARKRTELIETNEAIGRAQTVLAEAEETRKWMSEQKSELVRIEADRKAQEGLRAEVITQSQKLNSLMAELARTSKEVAAEEAKVVNLATQKAELTANVDKLNEQFSKLEQDIADRTLHLNGVQNDINLRTIDLDRLKDTQASTEKLVERARASLDQTLAELARTSKEMAAGEAKVVNLATQKAELTANVDKLNKQFSKLEQDIADRTLHLNSVLNDINLRTIDLDRLKDTQASTEKLVERAKASLDQTLAELAKAKLNKADTENTKDRLNKEVERLKAELTSLETWRATLTALLKKIEADLKLVHPQSSGEDRYRDLWEPVKFPNLPTHSIKKEKSKGAETDALKKTDSYLKSHGLHYPKRVLYAFHTALKTADMSPLVVLAGISGTGKSLLPKRYAEAMGIHMISLAVQPRWDSPQDLFGYFNHIEGRYKATELARAMVQFQMYNQSSRTKLMPKGWKHDLGDRMLLVLLDEMNLARVEYYFSEFLSKLEMRRSILNNENDANNRLPVEIALDTGSLGKDEHHIRLYPGRNILFTGTMNEDESTQSLSDKVLDRASVLRFGRPAKMTSHKAADPCSPDTSGLAYETWRQWCEPNIAEKDTTKVNNWIGNLNDAMDQIGKPFAHRVHQAILAYVGNYPSDQKNRIQFAMADQIEQRIMPKLRGLELEGNQEALEAIKNVIKEAEDEALMSAFNAAKEHHSGTFLWRGIDRSEK